MGSALANEGVPRACFVWPETLYRRPITNLPHRTSCSPDPLAGERKQPLRILVQARIVGLSHELL
jgi:hypothetical protein